MKAVIVTAVIAVAVLAAYFFGRSQRNPEPTPSATVSMGLPVEATPSPSLSPTPTPTPIPTKTPEEQKPAENAFKPTRAWLIGVWSEGGFCEGDAGRTFVADGTWGTWAEEGNWTLVGQRLTLTRTMTVRDTASGEPEPIRPVRREVGELSEVGPNRFTYSVGRKPVTFERCTGDE